MRLLFSHHAREKMAARGITALQVEEAIKRGSKYLQKPDRIVAEYRYFSVVYRQASDCCFIITVKPRWKP